MSLNFPPAQAPTGIQRLVIIDPALVSRNGHNYNYAGAVRAAALARGMETLVICGKGATPEIIAEFAAVPHFTLGVGARLNADPTRPDYENTAFALEGYQTVTLNAHFFGEFYQMTGLIRPTDLLFLPALFTNELIAFSQWLSLIPLETRPFSTILLRGWSERPHYRAIHELVAPVLCRPEMKCRICTDSAELAVLFGEAMRRPVDLVPFPQISPEAARSARRFRPENAALTVGFVGSCRANRGFLLLLDAVGEVLRESPSACHFLIQAGGNPGCPHELFMRQVQGLWALPREQVTLVLEIPSTADYYAILHDCDIALLCYDPIHYRYEPSGVFAEAMTAGKVMVISAHSSLEREAQRFNAGFTSARDFSAAALADAIKQAVRDYEDLSRRSRAATDRARQFHSAENLVAYLLDGDFLQA